MSSATQLKQKQARRLRRKRHVRRKVFGTSTQPRLTVFRSHKNISCQLVDDFKGLTVASASSLSKNVRSELGGYAGNKKAAELIGKSIAEKLMSLGITKVQFDRNGYRFHGRVKALGEAQPSEKATAGFNEGAQIAQIFSQC